MVRGRVSDARWNDSICPAETETGRADDLKQECGASIVALIQGAHHRVRSTSTVAS